MDKKSKLCFLDKFILIYLIFETFLLRWWSVKSYYIYISIILVFIILFRKKQNFKINLLDIIISAFYILIVAINLISNGIKPLFIHNFYRYGIANLIVIVYILMLNYENIEGLKRFILKDLFKILNIYFIINIPIIIKQLDGTYFLMRHIENNPMYEDHITGLIGASGTHFLTFYWILLTLVNLYKQSQVKNKLITVLTFMEFIFMIIVSSQNDNTAFFVFFPIIMVQYLIKDILNNRNKTTKVFKFILVFLFITITIGYIYETNYHVNKFVNNRVLLKLEQYGIIEGNNISKGNDEERIALFKVALEVGNGYGLGRGIGSVQTYGDPSLPSHFGMSDISIKTYEGGLVYLLSLILIFTQYLSRIFIVKKRLFKVVSFIIVGVNITIMAIYTGIFRQGFFSLSLGLIMVIFNQHYNKYSSSSLIKQSNNKD